MRSTQKKYLNFCLGSANTAVIAWLVLYPASVIAAPLSSKELSANPIVKDINMVVDFLAAGVGIIVVSVIIIGGIQYMTAGDNPQAVAAAKQRISNGLIALVAFIFTFAFLQWLIPGGVFK
ncbi:hypothetical protein A3F38_02145 [Candidatus Saccharibacteria bacterium RIFCSPHIGHO2_12_FULL_48_21]|nr:MAG: hypothetical protein A3F38_02145 [Candidatus Saccharibacteria bacterium RIFCSPHIGHO2_12_FULL_48_21]